MKTIITPAEIKELTTVALNADAHKLGVTIPDAQQRHLRPLLGFRLYATLLAFVADAPEAPSTIGQSVQQQATAAAEYKTKWEAWLTAQKADPLLALWVELKPCLAQWAVVEAWPNLLGSVENAGVVLKTGNGQGTTTADAATLSKMEAAFRSTAVWRGDELVQWLESNKSDYPDYVSTRPLPTSRRPSDGYGGISI